MRSPELLRRRTRWCLAFRFALWRADLPRLRCGRALAFFTLDSKHGLAGGRILAMCAEVSIPDAGLAPGGYTRATSKSEELWGRLKCAPNCWK